MGCCGVSTNEREKNTPPRFVKPNVVSQQNNQNTQKKENYQQVNVLKKHLEETSRDVNYYDLVLTGDLGIFGIKIMKEYFETISNQKIDNIIDSGSIFYEEKNIYAGASGPVCLPLVFFDYILKQKKYKKILLIGTGSLHSVISSNQGIEIPAIAHAISLEVKY